MKKTLLLDKHEFHFDKTHLPALIHGEKRSGASLFTITLLVNLYTQGIKVIAITGFSIAKEEFTKQTESTENAQFFTKEQHNEFLSLITIFQYADDYVILLKNIELFDEKLFNAVKNYKNLIISGDLNKCSFKDKLIGQSFQTTIFFSPLDKKLPLLQKYEGYLVSQTENGTVSLEV